MFYFTKSNNNQRIYYLSNKKLYSNFYQTATTTKEWQEKMTSQKYTKKFDNFMQEPPTF